MAGPTMTPVQAVDLIESALADLEGTIALFVGPVMDNLPDTIDCGLYAVARHMETDLRALRDAFREAHAGLCGTSEPDDADSAD